MTIKIQLERSASGFALEIDGLNPDEIQQLRNYGLKHIVEDEDALIKYGFSRYMEEFMSNLEEDVDNLSKTVDKKHKLQNKT